MAHFAEIDANNIVLRVVVIPNNQESRGQEYLSVDLGLGGRWIQTSYNTQAGVHYQSGSRTGPDLNTPTGESGLRKNYAGPGYFYDEVRDAFIPPKLYPSWILNETSCVWEAPLPYPADGQFYIWNEELQEWQLPPIM